MLGESCDYNFDPLANDAPGGIFGTGTNGAYVEKVENISKLGDHPARKTGGYMIINTEWGGFNNTVSASLLRDAKRRELIWH